jgi:hypothetical protein
MAQTVTQYGKTLSVAITDNSDWLWSSIQSTPGRLLGIVFNPGAAGDVLIVRNGSITGPPVPLKSIDGGTLCLPTFGAEFEPCIDYSECTFSAGASVLFLFSRF